MIDKDRLFLMSFLMVVAFSITGFTFYAVWEARSQKGMCKTFNETTCGSDKHCHWYVPQRSHPKEDEYCKRHHTIDDLAAVGFVASTVSWYAIVRARLGPGEESKGPEALDAVWIVGLVCLFVALTAFLGAMWFVLGSMTAAVFFVLFATILCAWLFGTLVVLIASLCESTPPPDYNQLSEIECSSDDSVDEAYAKTPI